MPTTSPGTPAAVPLLFLHLSDIHFHVPKGSGVYELDADLRNELELDAERCAAKLGAPHAVLVSGDVAFSGHPDEYKRATEWLLGPLQSKAKYKGGESILCIPGNHDVDRGVVKKSRSIRDCHKNLRSCANSNAIHDAIVEYLDDSWVFYDKIENFNNFAAPFECDLSKDEPFWDEDFTLNDGSTLRVRGMNSTLISDDQDDKDHRDRQLVVGPHQYQLKSASGVEYLSVCHHPPDWLLDGEELDEWLNRRARVQVFGHKHVQKLKEAEGRLRIAAGAVHPERKEQNWEPRYNWFTVAVTGSGDARRLVVEVFPRVWSDEKKQFDAEFARCEGRESCAFQLPIDSWRPPVPPAQTAGADAGTAAAPSTELAVPAAIPMSPSMDPARTLAHRFLSLSYLRRLQVGQKLGLIHEEDEGLSERDKSKQMFIRAKENRMLGALWDEVEAQHLDGRHLENPFK